MVRFSRNDEGTTSIGDAHTSKKYSENTLDVTVEKPARQPSFLRTLVRAYGLTLLRAHLCKVVCDVLTFVGPLLQRCALSRNNIAFSIAVKLIAIKSLSYQTSILSSNISFFFKYSTYSWILISELTHLVLNFDSHTQLWLRKLFEIFTSIWMICNWHSYLFSTWVRLVCNW